MQEIEETQKQLQESQAALRVVKEELALKAVEAEQVGDVI